MRHFLIILLLIVGNLLYAADGFQVKVEWFGVAVPGSLILLESATGKVKWSGYTPTPEVRDYWDQVVLTRNTPVDMTGYTFEQATADMNAMKAEMATTGKLSGDPEAAAIRMWKALKRAFPEAFK